MSVFTPCETIARRFVEELGGVHCELLRETQAFRDSTFVKGGKLSILVEGERVGLGSKSPNYVTICEQADLWQRSECQGVECQELERHRRPGEPTGIPKCGLGWDAGAFVKVISRALREPGDVGAMRLPKNPEDLGEAELAARFLTGRLGGPRGLPPSPTEPRGKKEVDQRAYCEAAVSEVHTGQTEVDLGGVKVSFPETKFGRADKTARQQVACFSYDLNSPRIAEVKQLFDAVDSVLDGKLALRRELITQKELEEAIAELEARKDISASEREAQIAALKARPVVPRGLDPAVVRERQRADLMKAQERLKATLQTISSGDNPGLRKCLYETTRTITEDEITKAVQGK